MRSLDALWGVLSSLTALCDLLQATYELIVQRMSEELTRFQRERAREMAVVLRDFAVAQVCGPRIQDCAWLRLSRVCANLEGLCMT